MAIELIHTIIHGFEKDANTNVAKNIEKKKLVLDNALEPVKVLVEGIVHLIGKPGNTVIPGQFGDNARQGNFPVKFDKFSANEFFDGKLEEYKAQTEAEFIALSHTTLDELVSEASKKTFSTGGHILVSCYKTGNDLFLLVVMIKQRGGVSLDKDLVPIGVTEIDLSKVNQAVKINFARYKETAGAKILEDDEDDNEKDEVEKKDSTYLSFLGTGRNTEASEYFVSALGCVKGIKSSRATNNAIDAVLEYFSTDALSGYKRKAKDAVIAYLKRKCESHKPAQLNEIELTVRGVVPAEVPIEGFQEFLGNDKNKVPSEFLIHKQTVTKRSTIKGEENGWALQFDRTKLGIQPGSIIYFDSQKKTLTISSLSDKFIETIETALKD